jgi:general bacterial porin, GBP family
MKKTLVAIAAIAAATGAMAQSSVTLYGAIDAGYSDSSKTIAGVKNGQQAVSFSNMSSSRFGFKGVIETGISSNSGTGYSAGTTTASTKAGTTLDATTIGARELNASLDFASGTTIGLGYGGTAVRSQVLAYDAMGGTNFIGNTLTTDTTFSSNRATGVGISQVLAKGLVAGLSVSRNTDSKDATGDAKSNGYAAFAKYDNGPLSVAGVYQDLDTVVNAAAEVAVAVGNGGGTKAVAASNKSQKVSLLGASYDLGVAKLFTQYGTVKVNDDGVANTIVVGEGKRTAYNVGVQVPYGAWTFAAVMSAGNKTEAFLAANAGEKRDFTGKGLGARYALSKRTLAYVNYGTSTLKAGSNATNFGSEVKNTQTAIGLLHNF